jgi:hypothetical protein
MLRGSQRYHTTPQHKEHSMPFTPQQSQPQPRRQASPDDYPLQKLCGLFPSRAGNALMGNLREQDLVALEVVIAEVRRTGRPLRVLIFESRQTQGNQPPYTMNVTLGLSRPQDGGGGWQQSQPRPAPQPYLPPDPDGVDEPEAGSDSETPPEWVQPPPPPPAPSRPRRMPPPRP